MDNLPIKNLISVNSIRIRSFRYSLLEWSSRNVRQYSWRDKKRTPYEIMIAEVLLKRTTATSASKVYDDFIRIYPNIIRLANAKEIELHHILTPVGLQKQRAETLVKLSHVLRYSHESTIPRDLDILTRLPGIGQYSARAILSFGFGIPVAIVDSNVKRVLHRFFFHQMPSNPTSLLIQTLSDAILPLHRHRQYNFGMLDLGSLVCRYSTPKCKTCPFVEHCDFLKYNLSLKEPVSEKENGLKIARQARGISLSELARRTNMSKLTIINIEAGRSIPRLETIKRIARVLHVSPSDLVEIKH
jgi:A/G-specific adenine glycosylase